MCCGAAYILHDRRQWSRGHVLLRQGCTRTSFQYLLGWSDGTSSERARAATSYSKLVLVVRTPPLINQAHVLQAHVRHSSCQTKPPQLQLGAPHRLCRRARHRSGRWRDVVLMQYAPNRLRDCARVLLHDEVARARDAHDAPQPAHARLDRARVQLRGPVPTHRGAAIFARRKRGQGGSGGTYTMSITEPKIACVGTARHRPGSASSATNASS